jgi:ferrous-iron efflux pump FieF
VILALFLDAEFGWTLADPLFAIAISFYILNGAYEVGIQAYHVLMDRELPDEDRAKITAIAAGHPKVLSTHDLRTRQSGQDVFIQIHLEMPRTLSLLEAHQVADEVMFKIKAAYPRAEVLTHQDPQGVEEPRAFDD